MFSPRTDVAVSFAGEQADRWAGAAASPASEGWWQLLGRDGAAGTLSPLQGH